MREDPWHKKEEEYLSKIEKQCNAYSNYFNKDYKYYHALSARFNIPILFISSVNALCAISLNDFLSQRFVSILNAVLSAGTGFLGSIQLYLKINEKMANAMRSSILMKRLALKISKELSVDREQRVTEGQVFLQECFGEFNAALEQANPIEKKMKNFLELGEDAPDPPMVRSFMNLASAAVQSLTPRTSQGKLRPLSEPRARTLWGFLDGARRDEDSHLGSGSPADQTSSSPGEESPRARDVEP